MSEQIKIKLDRKAIRDLEEKAHQALVTTALVLQDEMREEMIIPRATGSLQNERFFVDTSNQNIGRVRLVFRGPYARRLYFHPEFNFRKDQNPNAQGLWMRPWMRGGKYEDRAEQIFAKVFKRE